MKLRTLWVSVAFSALGLTACEEGGETTDQPAVQAPPAEAQKPAEPPKPPEPTPTEICGQFTAAVKGADEAKMTSLLGPGSTEALAPEGTKAYVTSTFSDATCGEAKIEGDKATVPVTIPPPPAEEQKPAKKKAKAKEPPKPAEPKTVEVPFVKAADGWKVDLAAYLAAHPMPAETGGKKGKKAKKKK